jgi:hypothetical protein
VRLVADTTVKIGNDALNPVPVRGYVALDPSEPVPLPVNSAKEKGGNLDAIAGRMPALGAAPAAAAVPVTIASDQLPLAFNSSAAAEDGHLRASATSRPRAFASRWPTLSSVPRCAALSFPARRSNPCSPRPH